MKKTKQPGKTILLAILILVMHYFPSALAKTSSEPPLVLMLLWRGMTEAETGFQNYFATNGLPVRYEIWNAGKSRKVLSSMINQIPQLAPDLIYTFGTTVSVEVSKAALNSTTNHYFAAPQVFNIVADPLGAGLIQKKANADLRDITGVSHNVPVTAQIEAMKELDNFKSIAALFNPMEQNSRLAVAKLSESAEKAGLLVEKVEVSEERLMDDMPAIRKTLAHLKQKGVGLVYLPSDSLLISHAQNVVRNIHEVGLLTFSATETPIRQGNALIGIVSPYRNVGQLAAYKAKQILFDGKNASEIPVETLSRFSLIVNMHAAHQLNYYPPVTMMQFAEVIQ